MRGIPTLFRFALTALVLCVLSFGTTSTYGVDSLAYPRSGASGVWTEISSLGARSLGIDENGDVVEYEEDADLESLTSEPGFGVFSSLRVFGEDRASVSSDDVLFRGQSVVPPTESPTSTNAISASNVPAASSNVTTPPVTSSSGASSNEETTFQRVFKNSQDFSASFLYMTSSKQPDVDGKPTMRDMEIDARILFACPCGSSALNNGYFLVTPNFKYTRLEQYQSFETLSQKVNYEKIWNYYFEGDNEPVKETDITVSDVLEKKVRSYSGTFYDFGVTGTLETALRDLEVHGELTLGLASSFKTTLSCKSFYVRGRLVGELPVDSTKKMKIVGGAAYYGRIRYKVLPVLGFVWNPNPQNEFRVIYPNPRWSHFLTKVNGTDWWFYIHGELGGGTWRSKDEQMDYNDYRVGLGVTFDCSSNLMGSAEIGGAFGREIQERVQGVTYKDPIKDAFYFKFGLLF